ncbi:3-deoxy-manno-octulosonate cytidylyltransferase [Lutibaculum baratangense]|uniref:3-deoxy-manno-octulosonate cytidylyltransferase n=1 Tax=Lutibaculum baratangense AMV1 TaxID=631454 RepID=V4RJP0_9HYPH|nr:3-deoxy-manno-octulosonate cytidylyltransferase [Lutibaculum baratangense]ESR25539.1 3-deoxy-manno-octulosonate cytidylyltransferase [Lutibaculum baratangense AMV1]
MSALVVIPARLGSPRIPRKPLSVIAGRSLILHVLDRAREADVGPVVVATDAPEVADLVRAEGGEVVMTRSDHTSGSDRAEEAARLYDPEGKADVVIDFQADLPTLSAEMVRSVLPPLQDDEVAMATLAAPIVSYSQRSDSSVVKVVGSTIAERRMRALYFTRAAAPWGDGPLYHHVGLYAWRRTALTRFASLSRSVLERRERLEQLRALEAGMRIDVVIADDAPVGVHTAADLVRAEAALEAQ